MRSRWWLAATLLNLIIGLPLLLGNLPDLVLESWMQRWAMVVPLVGVINLVGWSRRSRAWPVLVPLGALSAPTFGTLALFTARSPRAGLLAFALPILLSVAALVSLARGARAARRLLEDQQAGRVLGDAQLLPSVEPLLAHAESEQPDFNADRLLSHGVRLAQIGQVRPASDLALAWLGASPTQRRLEIVGYLLGGLWVKPEMVGSAHVERLLELRFRVEIETWPDAIVFTTLGKALQARLPPSLRARLVDTLWQAQADARLRPESREHIRELLLRAEGA